ncbi:hypothetical protein VTN77DRAFT_6176 [Rasamsonia byssochlamydoides]|uniref:uncharacterized protein n=1 Tax=Rasamsonia byssochlamydoides TaxID=89139 RepID=UPI00374282F9
MISCVSDSSNVCLFYNEEEFNDVLQRLCSRPWSTFAIAPDARDYLYSMTNGHPGAVDSLVSYIFEIYRSELKKGIPEITKQHLVNSLDDEAAVFQRLNHAPVFRSFPSSKQLTVPAANVLRQVLQEGSIPCNLEDPGIKLCYEMGWVHSDHTDQPTFMDPEVVCFLPSRLHEKFVEYFLQLYQPKPFPLDKFPSLPILCEAVLRHFSRKNLLSSVYGRHTPATIVWPPEAQFQDEWYRAFYSLVGHGVAISSEWSRTGDGRIDFRIIEPAWGIELLRDGDRLSERCNRFSPQSNYHRWISDGLLKDWLILDCRHSTPQKYNVPGTKLWRVVFREDYTSVCILNCNNEAIVPEFPLLD